MFNDVRTTLTYPDSAIKKTRKNSRLILFYKIINNLAVVSVSVVVSCISPGLRSILAAGALSSYMKARLELDHVISDLICTD